MVKNVLVLGASGTVGAAVFKLLSCEKSLNTMGTYYSSDPENFPGLLHFSVETPKDINSILKQTRPDYVISSLRGDFNKQLIVHENIAEYLINNGGKMLYLSSANVFDGNSDRPHYEDDAVVSNTDYGQFKIQCEALLRNRMGDRAILLRLPFVWGRNSPRLQEVKTGCEIGKLEVYTDFYSNHASDVQVAETIQWIIKKDKRGIFHVGTSEVINYQCFIGQLIGAMEMKSPEFIYQKAPKTMAVLSSRKDVPDELKWTTGKLVRYLSGT